MPSDDPLLGTVLDERYRLDRALDESTDQRKGRVYEAMHLAHSRRVAVRVVPASVVPDRAAFDRGAAAVSRVAHPACVGITDYGFTPDGAAFLVSELVDGKLLAHELRSARVPLVRAVRIVRHVLGGLGAVHEQELVHGTITPRNILLVEQPDRRDGAVLVDLGLATLLDVRTGAPYAAPESIEGKPIDHRTDLYALCAVAYHALAGRAPFLASRPRDALRAPVPPMTERAPAVVPPEIEATIRWGMAKDPADRPQSARELLGALDRSMATVASRDKDQTRRIPDPDATTHRNLPRERQRRRRVVWPALLGLIVLGGGAALAWRLIRDPGSGSGRAAATAVDARPASPSALASDGAPPAPAWRVAVDDARARIAAGDLAGAGRQLAELGRRYPDRAEVHRALGALHLARNWPAQTLRSYRAALARDPALRADPEMIAGAISLLDSNSRWWDAVRFLQHDIGAAAAGAVQQAAAHGRTPMVRQRAAQLLRATGW